MNDYYQILEVKPNASQNEIKNQYRFLVQAWHPDKFGSPESKAKAEEKLKQINEAFNVLKDPIKRDQYDRKQREQEAREKTEADRRYKEQAEFRKREHEARAQREAKENPKTWSAPVSPQPPTPAKKTAVSTPRASLLLWMGVVSLVFVLFLVWLVARAFSPESPIVFIATATELVAPLTVTEMPTPYDYYLTRRDQTLTETPLTVTEVPTVMDVPTESPVSTISDGVAMLLIPAGEFTMGSDYAPVFENQVDRKPIHTVYLPDHYIDQYEVTNAAYKRCVDAGACDPPSNTSSPTRTSYYGNPEFDEYPVIYVDWNMANTYCSWRNTRLPTEAEWEKAARGVDERTYPWGEGIDCDKANYCGGDTKQVGFYESNKSPYGIFDMAGNVWEWVSDWYGITYYQSSPSSNPLGPDSGQYRVLRGGSWSAREVGIRSASRFGLVPDSVGGDIGFRCARSP